ncbi:VOC family protein [Aquihabitans sp. G128]|uniref:VOC family protein n=1 Tax=Aquihabitans sp. G128 TaxID=2849779 RepID=UPI001C219A36|nr:VOC family protein [Aquihabitans sp. G128]QXC60894.1 VOC family protein [Aquihabitans sp. G128]
MALQGFSHIGICVTDIERSTRFYTEALGFTQLYGVDFVGGEVAATMEQDGGFRSAMLLRDDVRIELLQWIDVPMTGTGERKPMTQLGFTHLSFRVDDIDELTAAVRAAGGEVHAHTLSVLGDPAGAVAPTKLLYLTDPDGTRIELMENVPDLSLMAPSAADALAARFDPEG